MQQKFSIGFKYPVVFTENVFKEENLLLRDMLESSEMPPAKVLFIVDKGLVDANPAVLEHANKYFNFHKDAISVVCKPLLIPGGEGCKNDFSLLHKILEAINTNGICRHSYVVVVGGGAVLDLVGFAAAIAHRGVRLVRIPTTVLAQNDSGVGVKNSINYFGKKNFLGTFSTPFAVINDCSFLTSLDIRDWRSGIAEAVKVALIKDKSFFEFIEAASIDLCNRNAGQMQKLLLRCAALHLDHIASGDPFEFGSSRPLDFGHWAAHKLEYMSAFQLRHGEAVAIGIALDSIYSFYSGWLSEKDLLRILAVFEKLGFALFTPELKNTETLLMGLNEFREHLGGRLTITLLEAIGKGKEVHEIDEPRMLKSLEKLVGLEPKVSSIR